MTSLSIGLSIFRQFSRALHDYEGPKNAVFNVRYLRNAFFNCAEISENVYLALSQYIWLEKKKKIEILVHLTFKLSCSCMPNMKTIIASHNKNILPNVPTATPQQRITKTVQLPNKNRVPTWWKMPSTKCGLPATITTDAATESYVGLATNFKERYRNHRSPFRHTSKRNEPELSKHIWTLKDAKKPFGIKWKVLKRCQPYNNVSKKCNLCLHEKFVIICRKDLCSLNKRNELASSCPHRHRYVLKNFRITKRNHLATICI